jgi:DNA-directed RNA polymerase
LKFRIGSSASPSTPSTSAAPPKREEEPTPSAKKTPYDAIHDAAYSATADQLMPPQPVLHSNGFQHTLHPPVSPEHRRQPTNGAVSFNSFAAPPSPSKVSTGPASSPPTILSKPVQYPQHSVEDSSSALQGIMSGNTFSPQRPSSSHSTQSHAVLSPIQNRPSMSPTQGNRDVGPLAGFPRSTLSNGSVPSTPYGQHQTPRPQNPGLPPLSSSFDRRTSFSSVHDSFAHTPPPPGSQGMAMSGLSPTKNSPRPMTSESVGGASILPPIHRLEPSPKLMGRSSPDAPIPPPVKMMTPEQEERRQRENQSMVRTDPNNESLRRPSLPSLASWNLPPMPQQAPPPPAQGFGQHDHEVNGH